MSSSLQFHHQRCHHPHNAAALCHAAEKTGQEVRATSQEESTAPSCPPSTQQQAVSVSPHSFVPREETACYCALYYPLGLLPSKHSWYQFSADTLKSNQATWVLDPKHTIRFAPPTTDTFVYIGLYSRQAICSH